MTFYMMIVRAEKMPWIADSRSPQDPYDICHLPGLDPDIIPREVYFHDVMGSMNCYPSGVTQVPRK